jgi:hypothetical protein
MANAYIPLGLDSFMLNQQLCGLAECEFASS